MKTTKTFSSWIGDKDLTRDEYIREFLDTTIQVGALFDSKGYDTVQKYFAFRDLVSELAGQKWDNSK